MIVLWVSVSAMTSSSRDGVPAVDAADIVRRLPGLWSRLTFATWQWTFRQWRAVAGLDYCLIDYQGVVSAATRLCLEWSLHPERALAAVAENSWRNVSLVANHAAGSKLTAPNAGNDKRFQDKAWSEDHALRLARDLYLINSSWLLATVRGAQTLDRHDRHKLEFYTRQLLSAVSPSNWPALNPQVRACMVESCGENLVRGLNRLAHDLERGKGLVPILSTTLTHLKWAAILRSLPEKWFFAMS
jgi:poly(hydroxyalkanoate) polymerase-like protein